jgi:hypothetical protein
MSEAFAAQCVGRSRRRGQVQRRNPGNQLPMRLLRKGQFEIVCPEASFQMRQSDAPPKCG